MATRSGFSGVPILAVTFLIPCSRVGIERAGKNRGVVERGELGAAESRVAIAAEPMADRRHLLRGEELQPRRRLLDLEPLALDPEPVAPAAHLELLGTAR